MIGDPKDKRSQGAFTTVGRALAVAAFKRLFGVDINDGEGVFLIAPGATLCVLRGVVYKNACS